MNFLFAYIGFGFLVLFCILIQNFLQKKQVSEWSKLCEQISLSQESYTMRFLEKILFPIITGFFVVVVWPVVIIFALNYLRPQKNKEMHYDFLKPKQFTVELENLIERMAIEEIEELEKIVDPENAVPGKPFGHFYPQWSRLMNAILPSDEIWSFEACWDEYSNIKEIRTGYALLREGKIIDYHVNNIRKKVSV